MKVTLSKSLQKFAQNAPAMVRRGMEQGLRELAMRVEGAAKRLVYGGGDDHLTGDTGRLRQSITHEVNALKARVGSNLVYAPIHEFGGTIRPTSARNLAIPIGTYKGSPREHADLDFIRTHSGTKLLVDQAGTAQYVLRPYVTLKSRAYLRPGFKQVRPTAKRVLSQAILREVG